MDLKLVLLKQFINNSSSTTSLLNTFAYVNFVDIIIKNGKLYIQNIKNKELIINKLYT